MPRWLRALCLTSPEALSIMTSMISGLEKSTLWDGVMAEPQDQLFTKLRGIIGGYVVDLILEEGGRGIARLIREGLEAKARLEPEDDEKVMQILRRLEEDQ
jgi:hypothetical protein